MTSTDIILQTKSLTVIGLLYRGLTSLLISALQHIWKATKARCPKTLWIKSLKWAVCLR